MKRVNNFRKNQIVIVLEHLMMSTVKRAQEAVTWTKQYSETDWEQPRNRAWKYMFSAELAIRNFSFEHVVGKKS